MLVALVLLCGSRSASAQYVSNAINDLATATDYKVRLAAAATLSKSRDPRALSACIKALGNDPDKSVRAAAAMALKRLVTTSSSASDWLRALSALSNASANDKDRRVRRTATKVRTRLVRSAPAIVTSTMASRCASPLPVQPAGCPAPTVTATTTVTTSPSP